MFAAIILLMVFLASSAVICVSIAWVHHPRGIVRYFIHRKKG